MQSKSSGRLEGRKKVQVVVIGGGITGTIAALFLVRAGKSVTLLEGRSAGEGDTSRSTAHLTEILDASFDHLLRRFGEEKILRYSEAHRMAINRLGSLLEELGGPGACGWSRVPGYLYSENDTQIERFRRELAALEKLKIPCALVKHVPLPFSVAHAIRVENQAQVNPQAARGLLMNAFVSEGGTLHDHSRVTEITPIRNGVRVTTEHGMISCDHCVVATHTPIVAPSLAHFDVNPRRTYVIGATLRNAPLIDGIFWDTESPYHYIRMADGQLIVGGEDHRTGSPDGRETSSMERLEDYVRSRFEVDAITSSWSGQVFESVDGLPLVGPSLRSRRIFYATGYSGNGISQGTLSGILLSELVLGRSEDLARVLRPHRAIHPGDMLRFVSHNMVYPSNVSASLLGRPVLEKIRGKGDLDPGTLAPGEARVGTIDGRRVAAHCDSEGRIRTLSARCTHLGGEVAFNDFEKSWDCPCHGSRFDLDGNPIVGPAAKPLAEYMIERRPSAKERGPRKGRERRPRTVSPKKKGEAA